MPQVKTIYGLKIDKKTLRELEKKYPISTSKNDAMSHTIIPICTICGKLTRYCTCRQDQMIQELEQLYYE